MPASITLSNLAWSTPDQKPLFSGLDLVFGPERAGLVGRNGVGKTTLLKLIYGRLSPHAGRCATQGRLGFLEQVVQSAQEETVADLFDAREALVLLARAEAGGGTAADLAAADWTLEARIAAALAEVGLEIEPATRLATLSGGQQTRARLAALAFDQPDFLLLDEPTNNLDREGRDAVLRMLSNWRAGAIVVSHDRELLEGMDAIVELTSLGATRYGGGWSHYRERQALERAAAGQDLANAERRVADLARSARATQERKARKDGAGQRKAARGDQPKILLGAMKNRSEATSGDQARLAERRRDQAQAAAVAARERIEIIAPLTVELPSAGLASQKEVLRLVDVTVGRVAGRPVIGGLAFAMTGPERVAVTGPNGSGKTTLLALIAGELAPWRGQVLRFTPFAMLDQRAAQLDPTLSIRDNFRRLNPGAGENACRAALARFRFRADAALQRAGDLSGGQMLRAGLACALGAAAPPPLLMLDEPTNHLDLDSMEALEAGLRAYDGALLVVSHDERFLEAIGVTRRLELAGPAPPPR
jgi:ATPase subunit of ABC transporter with duplicated ATPase domains